MLMGVWFQELIVPDYFFMTVWSCKTSLPKSDPGYDYVLPRITMECKMLNPGFVFLKISEVNFILHQSRHCCNFQNICFSKNFQRLINIALIFMQWCLSIFTLSQDFQSMNIFKLTTLWLWILWQSDPSQENDNFAGRTLQRRALGVLRDVTICWDGIYCFGGNLSNKQSVKILSEKGVFLLTM